MTPFRLIPGASPRRVPAALHPCGRMGWPEPVLLLLAGPAQLLLDSASDSRGTRGAVILYPRQGLQRRMSIDPAVTAKKLIEALRELNSSPGSCYISRWFPTKPS